MADPNKCTVDMVHHAGQTVVYRRVMVLQAHELGTDRPVPLTPELVAAIEAEERRQRQKKSQGGASLPQTTNAAPTQE